MPRIAKSLATLRDQINARAPNRSKSSDGWIGDPRHQATASDHNPNSAGVVTALDVTHDPKHGFDSWAFAEMLRLRKDSRIKYVISNGRIFSSVTAPWQWRRYTGSNKHDHHVHVSVLSSAGIYDDARPWDIAGDWNDGKDTPPSPPPNPVLRRGSKGGAVERLQRLLLGDLSVDGDFGPKTEAAVIAFQKVNDLTPDGVVGPYTWDALLKK